MWGWSALVLLLAVVGDEGIMMDAVLDGNLVVADNGAERLMHRGPIPEFLITPFTSAFVASYLLIIVSELGDKTFFIAALLSMKRGAKVIFVGAASALAVMTVLSACAGRALWAIVDPKFTHYASVALFTCFGIKLLWEAYNSEPDEEEPEELREVELAITERKEPADALEKGEADSIPVEPVISPQMLKRTARTVFRRALVSAAFTEAFTMTFAAEWGDRSQIATLAMGASKNIWGVNLGAICGHLTCTGLAVLGGRYLATKFSERHVNLAGGITFLAFAAAGFFLQI